MKLVLSVNIHKEMDDFTLNINFESGAGVTALLGASGCGKSTALRCIAGLETPDRGRIVLNGRVLFDSGKNINLPPQQRRVGYLFREYALFPNMTVRDNLYAVARRLPRARQRAAVDEKLRVFRLEGVGDLYPRQLSGGQRQRAALARALASEPKALLLDEPFSAIDSHLRWQAELELGELLRPYAGDVILVTRERDEVCRMCKTVCVLSDGHSEETISVRDLMAAPRTVSAALISGCENFSRVKRVNATHVKCVNWGVTLETSQEISGVCSYVGVHAYDLHIARSGEPNRFDARVVRVIDNRASAIVMLAPEGGNSLLRMELPKREWAAMRNPETVLLGVAPENVMTLSGEL